ncbi:hypothetical protein D0Z00_003448 [Geotrichum galactomycetum]|uniref:Uncharacterized protein n=1 Tax=Geotrichum galactomycetum TaxID=27317 RepID=A0ACB6V1H1_9ASCO|nr:hypothetical protein D0Z00_003448 [Geotrichum candidum]
MTKRKSKEESNGGTTKKTYKKHQRDVSASTAASAPLALPTDTLREEPPATPAPSANASASAAATNDDGEPDGEDEEDDDDGIGFGGVTAQDPSTKNEAQEREKLRLLLAHFSEDQMSRYEAFRRANLNRNAIKKLANSVLNQSISGNVAVALSGLAKVFVGELVEKAREVELQMDREFIEKYKKDNDGNEPPLLPIRPEHLREAWRLYRKEMGTVPAAQWRRQGGEGDGRMFR